MQRSGAGPSGGLLEVTLPEESAGATPPVPLKWREGEGNPDTVSD